VCVCRLLSFFALKLITATDRHHLSAKHNCVSVVIARPLLLRTSLFEIHCIEQAHGINVARKAKIIRSAILFLRLANVIRCTLYKSNACKLVVLAGFLTHNSNAHVYIVKLLTCNKPIYVKHVLVR
jgi:hypothetical protein